jgi:hypothetical protein
MAKHITPPGRPILNQAPELQSLLLRHFETDPSRLP